MAGESGRVGKDAGSGHMRRDHAPYLIEGWGLHIRDIGGGRGRAPRAATHVASMSKNRAAARRARVKDWPSLGQRRSNIASVLALRMARPTLRQPWGPPSLRWGRPRCRR